MILRLDVEVEMGKKEGKLGGSMHIRHVAVHDI